MNTRALRYFLAAAEALHFGRAAEQLGIAQPALSQQIRVLEAQLGVELFRRAHRRVELTDAGRVFQEQATALLAASDRAVRLAREAARGTAGELDIGYTGSVVFEPRLQRLLKQFRASFPHVVLTLHEHTVEELLAALEQRRLDIAFIRGPIGAPPPGVETQVFASSDLVLALPPDHPLTAQPRIAASALAGEGFIALPDPPGMGLAHSLRQLGEAAGFSPRIALRAGSVMSVLGLVGAGLGVGLIPRVPMELSSSAVALRELAGAPARTEVLLATRSRMESALERRFVEAVSQTEPA
jgi:DNA-binding transcriptional LysR family regulator